jgi:SAM-dependent methyltransferase
MKKTEEAVKRCYAGWGKTYYAEYYGEKAPYPPVHRKILREIIREHRVTTLLDAGCGPASFLRDILDDGIELYGFDLTPEMVEEGKRIFSEKGLSPDRIWLGNVLDPAAYAYPGNGTKAAYDAAICFGVLPHIPEKDDPLLLQNLHAAVRDQGIVILEARNQLFGLFTLNRYSYDLFMEELIQEGELRKRAGDSLPALDRVFEEMKKQFRMDMPPLRKGKEGEPGYDEILSRTHNPLVLKDQFGKAGFSDVEILFYHYHCLPPLYGSQVQDFFLAESLAMENSRDWRGYFMASAFLLIGKRI